MSILSSFDSLTALAGELPEQKMRQVLRAWPGIEEALAAGHSLKTICRRLVADGLSVDYNTLRACVSRIRRLGRLRDKQSPRSSPAAASPPAKGLLTAVAPAAVLPWSDDPAANLRERLSRQTGFQFTGTGRKEDLI
jgi:hypothetical protein